MEKENDRYVFGYESALNRMHRIIKWLIVVIIILIVSLVGTNLAWVIYENQFEDYSQTITQENEDGVNNYIGEDGIILNNNQ